MTNLVVGTEFATKVIDKYLPLLDESLEESLGYKTLLEQEVTDMVFGCSSRNLARLVVIRKHGQWTSTEIAKQRFQKVNNFYHFRMALLSPEFFCFHIKLISERSCL